MDSHKRLLFIFPPKLLSQSQAAACHPQVNTITARVFLWVMHTTPDGSEAKTDPVVSDLWPLCQIRLRSADPRRLFPPWFHFSQSNGCSPNPTFTFTLLH